MEMKSSVDKTALGFKTVRGELDEIRNDVHGKLTSLKDAVDKVEQRTNKLLKMEKKSEARIRRLEDDRYNNGETVRVDLFCECENDVGATGKGKVLNA